MPFLMFGLFFGLIFLLIGLSFYFDRKRRRELDGLAEAMGLRFAPAGVSTLLGELSCFQLANSGHNRRVYNCLHGSINDVDVVIFGYRYDTGGSTPTTYHHAACFVKMPLGLPAFRARPANIIHKIGNLFGYQDIDFRTHPEFSRRFHLSGENKDAIRAAFTPRVLEFMEREAAAGLKKFNIEGKGSRLLIWRNGNLNAPDVEGLLRAALALGEHFRRSDAAVQA